MSDKTDKIERLPLSALGKLEDTNELILQANEAVALHEMRRSLQRQAERDLLIEEMLGLIRKLSDGHIAASEAIAMLQNTVGVLQNTVGVLQRQQREVHERQNIISATCDVFAEQLRKEAEARELLAKDVADRD